MKVSPRDYIHMMDVVSVFVKALDIEKKSIEDRILMIGTGEKLVTPAESAKIVRVPYSKIEMEGDSLDRGEFSVSSLIYIQGGHVSPLRRLTERTQYIRTQYIMIFVQV